MELDLFDWKICASCQIKKRTEEFGKNKSQLGGLHYYCKKCVREKSKKNDLKYKAYQKLWRQKNSESVKEYQKRYKRENREKINAYQRSRKANTSQKKKLRDEERRQTEVYKKKRSLYCKRKYHEDIQFSLKKKFEAKLNYLLEKNDTVDAVQLIGCAVPEYKKYLSKRFVKGMNWDNYGKVWNIDRVV